MAEKPARSEDKQSFEPEETSLFTSTLTPREASTVLSPDAVVLIPPFILLML